MCKIWRKKSTIKLHVDAHIFWVHGIQLFLSTGNLCCWCGRWCSHTTRPFRHFRESPAKWLCGGHKTLSLFLSSLLSSVCIHTGLQISIHYQQNFLQQNKWLLDHFNFRKPCDSCESRLVNNVCMVILKHVFIDYYIGFPHNKSSHTLS